MTKTRAFVIVPPRKYRDDEQFLRELATTLRTEVPGCEFVMSTDHDQQDDTDFVIAPDGTPEMHAMLKILGIIERFDGSGPTKIQ